MSENVREKLAEYAHEAWSGWMEYLFSKGITLSNGEVNLPPAIVVRWKRQVNTPYQELPEGEKDSDRAEADKMIAILDPASLRPQLSEKERELTAAKEDEQFMRKGLERVAGVIGITDPIQLIAASLEDKPEETYVDILVRLLKERLTAANERAEKAEAELSSIDSVLARRPALADCKTRAQMVELACVIAGKATDRIFQLKAELEKARGEMRGMVRVDVLLRAIRFFRRNSWVWREEGSPSDSMDMCRELFPSAHATARLEKALTRRASRSKGEGL